jgi:hypothetical protein
VPLPGRAVGGGWLQLSPAGEAARSGRRFEIARLACRSARRRQSAADWHGDRQLVERHGSCRALRGCPEVRTRRAASSRLPPVPCTSMSSSCTLSHQPCHDVRQSAHASSTQEHSAQPWEGRWGSGLRPLQALTAAVHVRAADDSRQRSMEAATTAAESTRKLVTSSHTSDLPQLKDTMCTNYSRNEPTLSSPSSPIDALSESLWGIETRERLSCSLPGTYIAT